MPTGYHSVQYDCVPGGWLYNRCHLVAFQLAGQNDNIQNLITGTRRMNLVMKRFEDAIRTYIEGTGNHVLYRVSPDFAGDELVARGVRIEALSVEDGGAGISYDVYIPNVQDGVVIDYATGESRLDGEDAPDAAVGEVTYVLNTNTKRFHRPGCSSADEIKDKNREDSDLGRDEIVELGYAPCGVCAP
ncbi:DNA/RNA non-specific endonuclease [Xiamenia xianingshaonis]|uniref:DNA/RNA non-specific endonuclease n=1 Tax=Xiamenia xianingshaonis TaxID=2682776 RepID=UPI0021BD80B2|nr:DNA/RNA non-specific endonuclease [Xiamenia xianingshaonis]